MERLKEPGSGTRDAWKGVGASVLLHAATVAAMLFTISVAPPARTPLVIDLTIGGPWGPGISSAPAPAKEPSPTVRTTRPEPLSPTRAAPAPAAPVPAATPEPPLAPPKETTPIAAPPAPPDRLTGVAASRPSGSAGGIERAAASPGSGAVSNASTVAASTVAGFPQGASSGASTASATRGYGTDATRAKAQDRYMERSFAYIRDAIQQGIAYPATARRMGWEGRVVVAFLILPDGSVRDVRVVQGSGHSVLDRSAVEAVRKAAPFPKPPAQAEIITPVVYRLD